MASRLNGVMLLAAFSSRSQAYAQALARAGLAPEHVVTYGENAAAQPSPSPFREWQGIAFHDPRRSLAETCAAAGWPMFHCATDDINSAEVEAAIQARQPRLVIYSGRGGQIVGERLLQIGSPFLHIHSGWLPQYRGSTTLYYALLNADPPAASAIILDRNIDTGPVIARQTYPRPPAGMDIDQVYDQALRADLLVRLMRIYAAEGRLPNPSPQEQGDADPYYVIHPVLKHLALLSLGSA